jgi:hypothetical protein
MKSAGTLTQRGKNEITTPSVETVAKSDAEMHRNLASEKQFKQVKHSVVFNFK